jgi:hypothetical protein
VGWGGVVKIVGVLELGRRHELGLSVQASVIDPVDVLGHRDLQVVDRLAGPLLRISSALNSELKALAMALS